MQYLFPFEPAASRNAPIDAASPKQIVETSALHNFIASYIPIPCCSNECKKKNRIRTRPEVLQCTKLNPVMSIFPRKKKEKEKENSAISRLLFTWIIMNHFGQLSPPHSSKFDTKSKEWLPIIVLQMIYQNSPLLGLAE